MDSLIPEDSKALLESLEPLSISNRRPEPDVPRPIVKKAITKPKTKKVHVAEFWEDELSSTSEAELEQETSTVISPSSSNAEDPLAPPPTPVSTFRQESWAATSRSPPSAGTSPPGTTRINSPSAPRVRPEKQTAVAGRMIAGALGIRPPARTEEQRAYDRAMKEKEIKRRNRAKEEEAKAKEEDDRAKAAIWDG
ncbi:hypothetical protein Egran_01055 [Elaphomyces granulatus]|uniref:Uncharacterized protein n=1 Tax=Elaphomyces granulatus TaxID=519963 RepID=A0A232M427_9EURO|nr:hypothetical protein Egran_01055 [Elaphomyces granulatus]